MPEPQLISQETYRRVVTEVLERNHFHTFPEQPRQVIKQLLEAIDVRLFSPDQSASPQESVEPSQPDEPEPDSTQPTLTIGDFVNGVVRELMLKWPQIADGQMFPESNIQPIADALDSMLNAVLTGVDLGGGGGASSEPPNRANVIRGKRPAVNMAQPTPAKGERQYAP